MSNANSEQSAAAILFFIRQVALRRGLTHAEIAEKIGWSATHVSRALTAKYFPTLPKVLELAGAVGLKLFFEDTSEEIASEMGALFEKAMDEMGRRAPKNLN